MVKKNRNRDDGGFYGQAKVERISYGLIRPSIIPFIYSYIWREAGFVVDLWAHQQ